jgi:ribokinase
VGLRLPRPGWVPWAWGYLGRVGFPVGPAGVGSRGPVTASPRRSQWGPCVKLPSMHARRPRVAVVGHVEWVQFARVAHVPRPGEVLHARDPFEEPAGGGAVVAVQLARLAGESLLITALGEDEHGRRSRGRLRELGVQVHAARRGAPTRSAVTLVDDARERTITTFGARLEPVGEDAMLPWGELAKMDAVYFTAGDEGALRAARAARVLVASPRAIDALGHGVPLDALVLSGDDAIERREAARAQEEAELCVFTEGAQGGAYRERSGGSGRWTAAPPPGEPADSYGCGDSFAAGLTYGLAAGLTAPDALALAARCGAMCLTGRGPYKRQLTLSG